MSKQDAVNIFEQASRLKLTFSTSKGVIGTSQLWDLPLTSGKGYVNLDDIARSISREIKNSEIESFVTENTETNKLEVLRLDIVKRVIEVKLEERDAAKQARDLTARKIALKEALESKKVESLTKMTEEEIEAELKKLN